MLSFPTPSRSLRGAGGGLLTALVLLSSAAAPTFGAPSDATSETAELSPRAPYAKSMDLALGHGQDASKVVFKLADDSGTVVQDGRLMEDAVRHRLADKSLSIASKEARDVINSVVKMTPGSRLEPVFKVPAPLLDAMRNTGQRNTGKELADLSQFFVLYVPNKSAGEVVVEELLHLPGIETAYAQRIHGLPVDIPPTTPDFQNTVGPGQGYRDPEPDGIGIDYAWSRGLNGSGVTVTDIEQGWQLSHEDLDHLLTQVPPVPMLPPSVWVTNQEGIDHGTATIGVLSAGDNDYGTTGLVPGAILRVAPLLVNNDPTWIGPNAVVLATLNMQAGDVMLIEAEIPVDPTNPFSDNMPFETFPAEFAAVAQATALGIHVIEPAGNSMNGMNLDTDPEVTVNGISLFDRYFRDSGAVLVGAGSDAVVRPTAGDFGYHPPYVNSNFGSAVNTYSWGQNVTTLGYGPRSGGLANCANSQNPFPLFPADPDQEYTFCYNGTSSAGAIVAGAAAVLEQRHRQRFNQPFDVQEMRNHLSIGTPSLGAIGHQPALEYQLEFMGQGGLISHLFEPEALTNQSFQAFGRAVASAGDFNDDGTPDVMVGLPNFDVPVTGGGTLFQAGRVYVFSGATGDVLLQVDGAVAGDRLGAALGGGGDADFDGVDDVLIGIPGHDTATLADAGRVAIYLGSSTAPSLFGNIDGANAGEAFGSAVDFIGNINPLAEPFDDFVIGAPGMPFGGLNGRAVLTNLIAMNLGTLPGTQANSEFGAAVAGAGDLNGDGITDVLVGAPGFDTSSGRTDGGAVYAYSGTDGSNIFRVEGDQHVTPVATARYGASVDGAGDFNGDGRPDIVVGAPTSSLIPGGFFGRADILNASGNLIVTFDGGHPRDNFGASVAGVGDFNGDNYDDVAIGSPAPPFGFLATRPGRVHVKLGGIPTSDPPFFRERLFWSLENRTEWGASVAAVGDVNGDGLPDVMAGEPNTGEQGRAYVFSFGPTPVANNGLARLIADVPAIEANDTNGNGFGGGGLSPSTSTLIVDAGLTWAGADYLVVGNPDVGTFLSNGFGQLDAAGRTEMPVFGPIPSSLTCGAIGYRQPFLGAAARDLDGDGQYDIFVLTNSVEVEIMTEFPPPCQ